MLIHHNVTTQMLQMKKEKIWQRKCDSDSNESIILNNCLGSTESATYCPPGLVDGEDGYGNVIDGEVEQIKTYPVVWSLWQL